MNNDQVIAHQRAHAHGKIAADMAANGHANWARFHEAKMRAAQRLVHPLHETDAEVMARLGGYETVG